MAPPDLNSVPPSPRNPSTSSTSHPPTSNGTNSSHANATLTPTSNPSSTTPSNSTSTPTASHVPSAPPPTTSSLSRQNSSLSSSRRASQIFPMNPPPLPLASPTGQIPASVQSGHLPFPPLSPGLEGRMGSVGGSGGAGGDAGPMRLPRPLTPAELHLEMEKEQEAVVNRLTRELTALRAHSASVASTASSASTANFDIPGPTHPTSSRRHRSSSSASQPYSSYGIPLNPQTASIPHHHHTHRPSVGGNEPSLSTSVPIASTPSAISRSSNVVGVNAAHPVPLSSPRYEDTALHRQELEEAKKENERLRRRVRELEALVRGRRASSVSTQASAVPSAGGESSQSRERSVSRRGARPSEDAIASAPRTETPATS